MLTTKTVFTCSKSTTETSKQCVKPVIDVAQVPLPISHVVLVFSLLTLNKCHWETNCFIIMFPTLSKCQMLSNPNNVTRKQINIQS